MSVAPVLGKTNTAFFHRSSNSCVKNVGIDGEDSFLSKIGAGAQLRRATLQHCTSYMNKKMGLWRNSLHPRIYLTISVVGIVLTHAPTALMLVKDR